MASGDQAARLPIHLDHHATTPVDPRVVEAMLPYFSEDFGNAASTSHVYGWRAEAAVAVASETLGAGLGADPGEIVWTSGATESNNLALLGVARANAGRRRRIVSARTEHSAVLDPLEQLEREGFEVLRLPVDEAGHLDLDQLREAVTDDTSIVSLMAGNNEIGVLHPLAEIGAICRERGAFFHSDAAQAVGKLAIDVEAAQLDLLSLSAHKLYGPKGVGALYVRRRPRVRIEPILYGGGHQRGLRSGTLPVPLIVGLGRAVEISLEEMDGEASRLRGLRERLWEALAAGIEGLVLNGDRHLRLPANLNVSIPGVDAAKLLLALPDLALSTGSACSSASPEPSHVLAALGRPEALARASLRFGLGRGTTADEVERAAARVVEEVAVHRANPAV